MKKFLVTSCVAALLGAGGAYGAGAQADELLKLEPGGYFVGSVLILDDEISNISNALVDPDSYAFENDSQVRFDGVSVLDSGLRYGFRADVTVRGDASRASTTDDKLDLVDDAYIYLDGGFGRVEIGQQDGIAGQFSVGVPRALGQMSASGGNGDDLADPLGISPIETIGGSSDESGKIIYMTPSFGGLTLGMSFTPDTGPTTRMPGSAQLETGDDIVEFGVIYSRDFEALSLDVSATVVTADATPVSDDLEEWNAGVKVGFHGLSVGGSYRESGGLTTGLQTYEAYDIGVAYETGPWMVSAQFAEHEGELAGAPYENGYRYLISARYKVAKGLRIGAGFQRDLDVLADEEGTALILESALKF